MRSNATSKPRLTLVTHVDWRHVRQRPQQLAVALAEHYDVTVIAPVSRRRAQLVDNPAPGVEVVHLWRLPGSYRNAGIAQANGVLAGIQCGPYVRRAPVVVVTSPELWPWVQSSIGERTLVYDCMDDALAFAQDDEVRALKARCERELLARSNLVCCSSDELAARMQSRAAPKSVIVVPNGWDPRAFPVQPSSPLPSQGPLRLAYFGTISAWLDLAGLRSLVRDDPSVSVRLIGPLEGIAATELAGLEREPPVEHARLAQAVADAHALLLPFRVDELTRGVDPVKLYEYVALGKPIAAAYWPALDRFARMVTFYRTEHDLHDLVRTRAIATPPPQAEREAFLAPQSWAARADALCDAIDHVRAAR